MSGIEPNPGPADVLDPNGDLTAAADDTSSVRSRVTAGHKRYVCLHLNELEHFYVLFFLIIV